MVPPGSAVAEPTPPRGAETVSSRVAGASLWSTGSMGGILALRFAANVVLARLIVPELFGVVAVLRVCLIGLEQLSDVGIRGSVIYHRSGEQPRFLHTAWTVQILRGLLLFGACCALGAPTASFYEMPVLAWLLPVAGLEAINNGLLSVGVHTRQRGMRMGMPVVLEWIGLVGNLGTTLVWAWVDPSVWALVAGPIVGGVAKTTASHVLIRDVPMRLAWDRSVLSDIVRFGKWVFLGTVIVFVAQQFDRLYLAKLVPLAILGVYQVAWNFINQGTRLLTVISNAVLTPLFAEYGRVGQEAYAERTGLALDRFLPFALFVCVPICLVCPALFGFLYPDAFADAGRLGQLLAVVVWFMILQQVPRTALLAVGNSRGVAAMSFFNALVTVAGCIVGFRLGSTRGLILGNALGNLAGCVVGAWCTRARGLQVGGRMLRASVLFLGAAAAGVGTITWLQSFHVSRNAASLVVSIAAAIGFGLFVWQTSVRDYLRSRRDQVGRLAA